LASPGECHFLVDENLSNSLAATLRSAGYEAEHVYEAGLGGQLDTAIFAYAQANGRTIISNDLDFSDITRFGPPHNGIVIARLPNTISAADRTQIVLNALR
jgi:predicted nuclease of predicted toxin-antitoxin system